MMIRRFLFLILLFSATAVWAAEEQSEPSDLQSATNAPPEVGMLVFHGKELFEVVSVGGVPVDQTLGMIERRLKRRADSPLFRTADLRVQDNEAMNFALINADDDYVFVTWQAEADYFGKTRMQLAEERKVAIAKAIDDYRSAYDLSSLIKGGIYSVIATVIIWILIMIVIRLRRKEMVFVEAHLEGRKLFGLLEGESLLIFNGLITQIIQVVAFFWIAAVYINFVLSFFPWTFNVSATLYNWITSPLFLFWNGFVELLPDLVALVLIIIITNFVLKGFRFVFTQLKEGNLRIKGFYADWADPSYRLARFGVVAFALVAAWPYIPGSDSPAFKGISIFMGVLFSMGSTSVMGNIFSGLVITYMRPFISGDFVEINGTMGTVVERKTFSTRIKTTKNEVVNIPNSAITSSPMINYSRRVKKEGVLLYTSVTIGYDVPAETVEKLLLAAAASTDEVLDAPEPFVLVKSLDDFYVRYELNAATRKPQVSPKTYSKLHRYILKYFAEAGVEIMSPHYQHHRRGNESTIPEAYQSEEKSQP